MSDLQLLKSIARKSEGRIILFVLDGLGGMEGPDGRSEMESAHIPNMDKLAREGYCGLIDPVGRGIAPGSGPGHLSLFGYDPIKYEIGRGALSAAGIGFDLKRGTDVASRLNFCTVDAKMNITDRRAGRIPTEKGKELVDLLKKVKVPGVEVFVEIEREYRAVVVFRGEGLSDQVADSDPQKTGVPPLKVQPMNDSKEAKRTAEVANKFLEQAYEVLRPHHPANAILSRGYAKCPDLPTLGELYGVKSLAIALYPMYRGVAQFVGMDVFGQTAKNFDDQLKLLFEHQKSYDYIFLHYKHTDSAGEDGNFEKKVKMLEEADKAIPKILELKPDVLVVTGDHSTPAMIKGHSWHPVPVVMSSKNQRRDDVERFDERSCIHGGLGRIPGKYLMAEMLACAGKLGKFGA